MSGSIPIPAPVGLIPAPQYLSGDVRTKLDTARVAAATDPAYAVNVAALERVLPGRIGARLGGGTSSSNPWFGPLVPRRYDLVHLSLPGLATFSPHEDQVAVVARIIAEPSVGWWDEKGAGRTAVMAMAAMELRRLGLARKPAIVIPNHMLDQVSVEFTRLYPEARILAASSTDLASDKRRVFVARAATGDWDAIIITQDAFKAIPVSRQAQRDYLRQEITMLDATARLTTTGTWRTVKELEGLKAAAEERIKAALITDKDTGITFDITGIDYVFVDEARAYKNLPTWSMMQGTSIGGDDLAIDMHMKIQYLRGKRNRVATLATATPIASTMSEAYTMLRYLRPDLLHPTGMLDDDTFTAIFGQARSRKRQGETDPAREASIRLSQLINFPELLDALIARARQAPPSTAR